MNLERLAEEARQGSRTALEQLVEAVQDDIYGLAVRMLWHPQDAEDASQEILIRVITHLGSFRGDSSFRTWVYRVASNYLLTTRRRRMEKRSISFEEFGADLAEGLSDGDLGAYNEAEQRLLVEEVKIGCTQALLLCLDREHRLAYILGEIMELTSEEGASVLEITAAAFRKRLSRSRRRIRGFMQEHCGLVNPGADCRCRRRVQRAIELGRVDPGRLNFATHAARDEAKIIEELDELRRVAALHRSNPQYAAPGSLLEMVRAEFDSGRFRVLDI